MRSLLAEGGWRVARYRRGISLGRLPVEERGKRDHTLPPASPVYLIPYSKILQRRIRHHTKSLAS